jgi:hypothetical protein
MTVREENLRADDLCNFGWLWSSAANPQFSASGGSLRSTPATAPRCVYGPGG